MRKQIAAANWKMNLTLQQGDQLLNDIISKPHHLASHQLAIFAVPFPYLSMAVQKFQDGIFSGKRLPELQPLQLH